MGAFALAGAFAVFPISVAVTHVQPAPLEWMVVALIALASLLAVVIGVVHIVSLERVVLDGSEVRASREIGPLRFGWSVSLAEITSIQVPGLGREHMRHSWGVGMPALVVRTSARVLRCCFGAHPSDAEFVAERIRTTQERAT